MNLNDHIHVNYSTVEELFASKTIQPKETEKVKKSTEVSCIILLPRHIYCISQINRRYVTPVNAHYTNQ